MRWTGRAHVSPDLGRSWSWCAAACSRARADQTSEALREADAALAAAEAELQGARQALGPEGRDSPQILDAPEALREAQLNLLRTTVAAPGQSVMTFIDARAIWRSRVQRQGGRQQPPLCHDQPCGFAL